MLNKSFSVFTTINLPFFIPTSTHSFSPLSDLRIILSVLFILFLSRRYLLHFLFSLTRACLPFSFFPLESHLRFLLPLEKSTFYCFLRFHSSYFCGCYCLRSLCVCVWGFVLFLVSGFCGWYSNASLRFTVKDSWTVCINTPFALQYL